MSAVGPDPEEGLDDLDISIGYPFDLIVPLQTEMDQIDVFPFFPQRLYFNATLLFVEAEHALALVPQVFSDEEFDVDNLLRNIAEEEKTEEDIADVPPVITYDFAMEWLRRRSRGEDPDLDHIRGGDPETSSSREEISQEVDSNLASNLIRDLAEEYFRTQSS